MHLLTLKGLAREISVQTQDSHCIDSLSQKEVENILSVNYKYDCGKYKTNTKNKEMTFQSDEPIWYETRGDKNGPYLQLLTVQEKRLSEKYQVLYNRIIDIWQRMI